MSRTITDRQAAGPEQQSEQPAVESNLMSDTAVGGDRSEQERASQS